MAQVLAKCKESLYFCVYFVVKLLLDSTVDACPGLGVFLDVVGVDGEKALANQTPAKFSPRYLVFCSVHAKKNFRSKWLKKSLLAKN